MRWLWWADALLLALVLYYYLPDLTGEARERLLSLDYWLARARGEHLLTHDGVLWRGDPRLPVVALTFDDGPDPHTTPRILDILKQEGVKATFFVVGVKLKRYPELARRIAAEGHALGCHSYDHQRQTELSEEQVWRQIRDCQALARRAGVQLVAYRPPYLEQNEAVRRAVQRWRMPLVMATVLGEPEHPTPNHRWVYRYARRARNGSILLLHDTYPHTADALPELIRALRQRGYQFATIPEMYAQLCATPPHAHLNPPPVLFASVLPKIEQFTCPPVSALAHPMCYNSRCAASHQRDVRVTLDRGVSSPPHVCALTKSSLRSHNRQEVSLSEKTSLDSCSG